MTVVDARRTLPDELTWSNGVVARRLTDRGGRVDWYGGALHEDIAFDRFLSERRSEVFLMRPDGTDVRPVTEALELADGFVGQPAWHPDGEHLLVVAENERSAGTTYNHVSFGLDNDLWLVDRGGTEAHRLYSPASRGAVLHPHFNKDGTRLVFAERVATDESLKVWQGLGTPGGENPFAGWRLHLADFGFDADGTPRLSNDVLLFDDGEARRRGFVESHGFLADGRVVFSRTDVMESDLYGDEPPQADGSPFASPGRFVDDLYVADPDGGNLVHVVDSPRTWEEHLHFHPHREDVFAFVSSRLDTDRPVNQFATLRLELYVSRGGVIERVTHFNEQLGPDHPRWIVSDFDWDRSGNRIVFLLATLMDAPEDRVSETWVLEFPEGWFG